MLPTINGKDIIECSLDDLQSIIDNPAFAESEYLDYKKEFSIDAVVREQRQQEQAELRNDVCAFANANGGYLFFGIDEKKGIPSQILGISIKNNSIGLFEINMKNYLQSIKPRVPNYRIKFIDLPDDKYVVIMFIQHDYFAPYIHLVDQKDYKIYKRVGNSKAVVGYQELKMMFTQSLNLEREIERVREERISYFRSQEDDADFTYSKFFIMHIIPETFLDYNYNKPMFVLEKQGHRFSPIFNHFECDTRSMPAPEGLRYLGREIKAEYKLYNNGIAEYYYPLGEKIHAMLFGKDDKGELSYIWLWQNIQNSVQTYVEIVRPFMNFQRLFVCVSIIGCKDVITEINHDEDWKNQIDRDKLLCYPSVLEFDDNGHINDNDMNKMHLEFLTSIGVKFDQEINVLIEEIYGGK